jgi:3-dehydroquinate synthetase
LYSLDERQFSNGMAESIKMAAINDSDFFESLLIYNLETLMDPKNKKVYHY